MFGRKYLQSVMVEIVHTASPHHTRMQMKSTGIPELTCVEDTNYIRKVLEIDLTSSEHVAEMRFRQVIQKCLNLKWTVQIMWSMHIAKNLSE